jgi:hypothetical protein
MSQVLSVARFVEPRLADPLEMIVHADNGCDGQRLTRWLARRLAARRDVDAVDSPTPVEAGWELGLTTRQVNLRLELCRDPRASSDVAAWQVSVVRPAPGWTAGLRAERQQLWMRMCWAVHDELSRAGVRELCWTDCSGEAVPQRRAATPL